MTYSSVGIMALIIHLVINFDVLRGRSIRDHRAAPSRSYRYFLYSLTLFYLSDSFWGIFYEARLPILSYAATVFFFSTMALSILFWTRYVMDYLRLKGISRLFQRFTGWIIFTIQILEVLINFFWPVLFSFNEAGEYHPHSLRYFSFTLQMVMFLLTSVSALSVALRSKTRLRPRYYAVGFFGILMTGAIVLQVYFPLHPFYAVGCLLGTCLIHPFVLGDEKEEHRRELETMLRREQEQREALASARALAHTDALTGVGNPHAYVDAQLDVDSRIANGELTAFAVLAFDLNRLKQINDNYGHDAGDRYLCAACDLIRRSFPNSAVFRVGGDEFVAFLEGDDFRNRHVLFTAFDKAVEENLSVERGVVISAGMGVFLPGVDFSCHSVFTRADKAMYERKQILHDRADAMNEGALHV